jgi:hypothetical protein
MLVKLGQSPIGGFCAINGKPAMLQRPPNQGTEGVAIVHNQNGSSPGFTHGEALRADWLKMRADWIATSLAAATLTPRRNALPRRPARRRIRRVNGYPAGLKRQAFWIILLVVLTLIEPTSPELFAFNHTKLSADLLVFLKKVSKDSR